MLLETDSKSLNPSRPRHASRPPSYSDAVDRQSTQRSPTFSTITTPGSPVSTLARKNLRSLHVRSLHSNTRYKDIIGTYCVDPDLACQALEIRQPVKSAEKCKGKAYARPTPDAHFSSTHGAIRLNLAASSSSGSMRPARVEVNTKSGEAIISIFELQPLRRINLDVTSRRGNIVLLVSSSFSGAVQLRSTRGALTFLPAFARCMRVLKMRENEALVLFGSQDSNVPTPSPFPGEYSSADFCELTSRLGNVTVGIAGEDNYVSSGSGFWKKVGEFFSGEK